MSTHGYTCNKTLRLDHYQNGSQRLTTPLRREADGKFTPVDWDTAIAEVAQRFAAVRDTSYASSNKCHSTPTDAGNDQQ
ncbi:molybdopterin-dependent oxidoreductase [Nocardia sp. NPDC004168]|uniref:molybdopterin-dependent oxidoreductase n=1 Tax=Nocardia sp. NPDC004168 TaxID=3154452 RepID=UPI0033A24B48